MTDATTDSSVNAAPAATATAAGSALADAARLHKTQLRTALLSARQAMPAARRTRADAMLAGRIMQWWLAQWPSPPTPVLGIYGAIRGEPDLSALYVALHAHGVVLALPAVADATQPLRFLRWAPGDATQRDRYGVAVPVRQQTVVPGALLIPCVGFNDACMRLGYGGGFYDRTLAFAPRPVTLGVAYDAGETSFATEAHDIALDAIVTERRLLRPAAD